MYHQKLHETAWMLTSFKWHLGNWSYQSKEETPATLLVKDIDRVTHELHCLEYNEAMVTLGVAIASDGNMTAQKQRMLEASTKCVTQMKQGKLRKVDSWTSITSTVWKTLSYPLPATGLSKKECE